MQTVLLSCALGATCAMALRAAVSAYATMDELVRHGRLFPPKAWR
jgi:hypothetical protein